MKHLLSIAQSSVFILSGMIHSYRVIEGEGLFVNHVVGDYNSSLLGSPHISSSIAETASSVTDISMTGCRG
jgi:2-isopropylmalate synthase